jgi:hypothetical protein
MTIASWRITIAYSVAFKRVFPARLFPTSPPCQSFMQLNPTLRRRCQRSIAGLLRLGGHAHYSSDNRAVADFTLRKYQFILCFSRSIVTMAPKQAKLGYVKAQSTLG